jgi:hypothetical protein
VTVLVPLAYAGWVPALILAAGATSGVGVVILVPLAWTDTVFGLEQRLRERGLRQEILELCGGPSPAPEVSFAGWSMAPCHREPGPGWSRAMPWPVGRPPSVNIAPVADGVRFAWRMPLIATDTR